MANRTARRAIGVELTVDQALAYRMKVFGCETGRPQPCLDVRAREQVAERLRDRRAA